MSIFDIFFNDSEPRFFGCTTQWAGVAVIVYFLGSAFIAKKFLGHYIQSQTPNQQDVEAQAIGQSPSVQNQKPGHLEEATGCTCQQETEDQIDPFSVLCS